MMGGLAYMTGRPGDPLRAGTSVNDIMGGMFGAIGAMAALPSAKRPAVVRKCKARCLKTTCSWWRST
jgi:crotonobetainyl-CoA:carnitine CoA-transferase CaiB-like acyl-CoA transferase